MRGEEGGSHNALFQIKHSFSLPGNFDDDHANIILTILLQPGLIESIQLSHLVQLYDHTMDWSYMGAYDGESFGSTQM